MELTAAHVSETSTQPQREYEPGDVIWDKITEVWLDRQNRERATTEAGRRLFLQVNDMKLLNRAGQHIDWKATSNRVEIPVRLKKLNNGYWAINEAQVNGTLGKTWLAYNSLSLA